MIERGAWLGQVPVSMAGRRLGGAQTLTDATISQVQAAPAAVLEFWSPTCGVCTQFKPVYEDVANQMGGQVLMATANVNEAPAAAVAAKISVIPTTIFYVGGKEVARMEGNIPRQELVAAVTKVAAGTSPGAAGLGTWGLVAGAVAAAGLAAFFTFR